MNEKGISLVQLRQRKTRQTAALFLAPVIILLVVFIAYPIIDTFITSGCGDDLTVTNIDYLRKALDMGACGAFVFKPNQVGTVTEAMEAQRYAVEHGMFSIPSIRAGGVSDDPVADMGIAGGAAAVKLGPPKFGHAIHIVNSLLRAETELPEAKPFDFSPFVKF